MSESFTIEGLIPLAVHRPVDAAELCGHVREAAAAAHAVYPIGGRTALDLGLPPTKPGVAVDLTGLNAVVDYPARDLTVTVQAGVTVAALQAVLAAENQFLPVDVPHPERATVGGAVAANLSGPRRLTRGTFRDAVLGVSFVTDEGVEAKAGGRVVKNVAGYDLMKLHTGALGTLGILTQLTFKVQPRPEASAVVLFGLGGAAVGPTLDRLHASAVRPAAIELLNRTAAGWLAAAAGASLPADDPWVIACGFEEKAATLDWQVRTLRQEVAAGPVRGWTEFRDAAAVPLWAALTDLQTARDGWLTLKANVPPGAVAGFAAAVVHPDAAVHAHAGSGIVYAHLPVEPTPDRAAGVLAELGKLASAGNANVIVRRCPAAWKAVLPVWGRDTGRRALMAAVKRALDPGDLFNPGRM